jgi:hypothetical protein
MILAFTTIKSVKSHKQDIKAAMAVTFKAVKGQKACKFTDFYGKLYSFCDI